MTSKSLKQATAIGWIKNILEKWLFLINLVPMELTLGTQAKLKNRTNWGIQSWDLGVLLCVCKTTHQRFEQLIFFLHDPFRLWGSLYIHKPHRVLCKGLERRHVHKQGATIEIWLCDWSCRQCANVKIILLCIILPDEPQSYLFLPNWCSPAIGVHAVSCAG